jgi:ABC-type branched-subunit amino acid transport system ATPase component
MYLDVSDVTKSFGGVVAVSNCSLSLEGNKIYGLIGPNGSGKTTLFNLITGFLKPDKGQILYKGTQISGLSPRSIARKGIVRTFQLTRVFTGMTVMENLQVAIRKRDGSETAKYRELLKLAELEGLENEYAKNLSHGQRKQLEFIRTLMLDPDLIMLDEPMAGLSEGMIDKMTSHMKYARDHGKTVLVIEHNLPVIMGTCERIFVLENGTRIAEGTPEEIQRDQKVIDAYIGEG